MSAPAPQRIVVLGPSGSGKSTLARQLGTRLDLPVIHMDQLSWKPDWVGTSAEELEARLREAVEGERWVIDGNYRHTLPMRLQRADTAILLDYPRLLCALSILRRVTRNYGQVREDMAPGCPEKYDWELLRWTWGYRRRSYPRVIRLLQEAEAHGLQVRIARSRREGQRIADELCGDVSAQHNA